MHSFIEEGDGWKLETLSDDSDLNNLNNSNIEEKLKGCCVLKESKEYKGVMAEIRYEEQLHNELVYVQGIVFKTKNETNLNKTDVLFFRRKIFEGVSCKRDAATYAIFIKEEISHTFFSYD